MKKILLVLMFVIFSINPVFSQGKLDLTSYGSVDQLKSDFEGFNNAVYAGMNTLTWTDASAPSLFRFSAGVTAGFGSFGKSSPIGLDNGGLIPAGAGLQVGFGTAGIEAYGRFLPEMQLSSNVKTQLLGFGLKYELSDLIPVPAFPALAIFAEYNTLGFKLNQNRDTQYGTIKSGIDLKFKSTNIGILLSKDFMVTRIYGRAGIQIGSTAMTWNQSTSAGAAEITGDLSNSNFGYAVGIVLFGFRAEVGGRGSNLGFGLGWGISI